MAKTGLTPMMLQYLEMQREAGDAILFFRLGDFYEMFFDDAVRVARELELTLTGKNCGLAERAPMCGVPYHSADTYIARLVEKGYKVAICEQVEDPKSAKGLVRREIVRVISPGTVTDNRFLKPEKNNFLMAVFAEGALTGCAFLDLSTGEFYVTQSRGPRLAFVSAQMSRFHPAEVLFATKLYEDEKFIQELTRRFSFYGQPWPARYFEKDKATARLLTQMGVYAPEALGLGGKSAALRAGGALLFYAEQMQKQALTHVRRVDVIAGDSAMVLDSATAAALELTRTIRSDSKNGSLLGVLDRTVTAGGARLLARMLEAPLCDKERIEARLARTAELYENTEAAQTLAGLLSRLYDFERICTKASLGTAVAADLISLRRSLEAYREFLDFAAASDLPALSADTAGADAVEDVRALLSRAICEESGQTRFGSVYRIKTGYDAQLDDYRRAAENGSAWLSELEARERAATGIANLKIKYNKVFGYFIEVSNGKKHLVPERYIRKQTLTNAERFFTPELKAIEDKLSAAQEQMGAREDALFAAVCETVKAATGRIQDAARLTARADVFCALARVAREQGYTRPVMTENGALEIVGGRHPVVEVFTGKNYFIKNDTALSQTARLMLITGPNMAGKSTYIRQSALIVLMAQTGSFVPADSAVIPVTDRVFARVGASDDLATGQSTFMVEMTEVSNILASATDKSLVILDEVGRGTGTTDGVSIAWAVCEALLARGTKTLFATHYRELIALEEQAAGCVNYAIGVKETPEGVVFLRKIARGAADRSYGVEVARLAGFPEAVTARAGELLTALEGRAQSLAPPRAVVRERTPEPLREYLKTLDPDAMSPRDALGALYRLRELCDEN